MNKNNIDKQFLPFLLCLIVFGALCAFVAKSYADDKQCTITLKDHQGAYHQMTGKADD